MSDEDAQDALLSAFDVGIRYFDTAPLIRAWPVEERVGRAMQSFGADNILLSTKIGRLLLDCEPDEVTPESFVDVPQKRIVFDYTYDGVMRSFEASKAR